MGKSESAGQVGDPQFTSPKLGFHHKFAADSSVDEYLKNTAVLCHCLGKGVSLSLGINSLYHLNNQIIYVFHVYARGRPRYLKRKNNIFEDLLEDTKSLYFPREFFILAALFLNCSYGLVIFSLLHNKFHCYRFSYSRVENCKEQRQESSNSL